MQDILSQSEIDSLLEALTSGKLNVEEVKRTTPEVVVKSYDFRRPNKFSKEHLRTLEMIHQHYSRLLASFLSGYLRTTVNIEVASAGQMIYEEFIRSIPSPTVMAIFNLPPLEGSLILEVNMQLAFPLLELLFGSLSPAAFVRERELTDIEITVMRRLINRILEFLPSAWKDLYEVQPQLISIESNPRMQQLYAPNEVVALITFNVMINEESKGLMNLCLPYIVLEPVVSRLSVRQQFVRRTVEVKPEDMRNLRYWLGHSQVNLQVVIGETEITVAEFLQLQEGDVLVLRRRMDSDLDMYVEKELKFGVQAGRVGRQLAVQVVSLLEEEETVDG